MPPMPSFCPRVVPIPARSRHAADAVGNDEWLSECRSGVGVIHKLRRHGLREWHPNLQKQEGMGHVLHWACLVRDTEALVARWGPNRK